MEKLKLLLAVSFVLLLSGCATTPPFRSDFKKYDEATVVLPRTVTFGNQTRIMWGDTVFSFGDFCRLKRSGSVQVTRIFKRPEDSERHFIVYYWIDRAVEHTDRDCPAETLFVISEREFVRLTGGDVDQSKGE